MEESPVWKEASHWSACSFIPSLGWGMSPLSRFPMTIPDGPVQTAFAAPFSLVVPAQTALPDSYISGVKELPALGCLYAVNVAPIGS